ncbi:hypothetical protein GGR56DRAFT_644662 [Xylariaceae sp. FL0804]|nr:hypothetical protein GGR56DRAFT_644662 [Xylariaceae sp. FL0804]
MAHMLPLLPESRQLSKLSSLPAAFIHCQVYYYRPHHQLPVPPAVTATIHCRSFTNDTPPTTIAAAANMTTESNDKAVAADAAQKPAEQPQQEKETTAGQPAEGEGQGGNAGEGGDAAPRQPKQLLSHFKGLPRDWEKNKGKFPPKDDEK